MKVLVTGGNGMLGHKLVQRLAMRYDVYATLRSSFEQVEGFGIFDRRSIIEGVDLSDQNKISEVVKSVRPDVVINAAGVVKQRPSAKNVIDTLTINSILPYRLADLGQELGFRTVVISSDCVFSGLKGNYSETDPADALDLYGRSKNLGEVSEGNCLTIRTSIIGRELQTKHSLIEWFLSNRGGKVKGYKRAIYSGFPTVVFADIISNLLTNHPRLSGIYHVSSDPIDKYSLLGMVNDSYHAGIEIEQDETLVIDRSLDSSKFRNETEFEPPAWGEMIEQMVSDTTPYGDFLI
jgi:dTDP-4-dehydrorhamnose reductase